MWWTRSTASADRSTSTRPAIAAGIAAIRDTAHVERSRAHNTRWLAWLTEEIGKLGLPVTPSVANFVLIHFPETKGRTAKEADAFLTKRGLILRQVGAYKLPNALRMSVGTEEANRLVVKALGNSGEDGVSKPATLFNRLALIGVGLIGSSIARAARAQGAARSIVATARSPQTRRRVAELGLADQVVETNAAAVEGADLVIVCIPVGACGAVAKEIGPHLAPGAIVSDVGSVKGSVVRDMAPHLPKNVHFVPAHPVAGTEYSGPDAGFAELFVNRWCILTPPEGADPKAVDKLAAFWRLLGANVETMTPDHHDLVLAITSHLPHLIAYTIVGTADELQTVTRSEVLKFSAGGFRDFTRIAASDPTMWRDVFLANKDAVLEMLGRFNEDISALTKAIRNGDGEALFEQFTRTRAIRKGIVEIGQDSPAPDFGRPHPDLPHEPLPKPYASGEELEQRRRVADRDRPQEHRAIS